MSSFTKKNQRLKEGDKVLWDGINAMVIAAAEEDTECPYRVFSEKHVVSGWVAGEVLELVEAVIYAEVEKEKLRVGDFVETQYGKGVLLQIDADDPVLTYYVGILGGGVYWEEKATFLSRPDYGTAPEQKLDDPDDLPF